MQTPTIIEQLTTIRRELNDTRGKLDALPGNTGNNEADALINSAYLDLHAVLAKVRKATALLSADYEVRLAAHGQQVLADVIADLNAN